MTTVEQPTAAELRRAAQREEIRAEILAASRTLVDQEGPKALTMRAVARSIGYSPGALYEYFDSKQDILEALYFQGTEGLEGRTRQVVEAAGPHASTSDRVSMAGRAYRSFALDHPDLYLLIFSMRHTRERGTVGPDHLPDDSSFGSLVELLRAAQQSEEIGGGEPEHLAAALWSFVHGFVMLEITERLPTHIPGVTDRIFETGLELLGEGLRPRPEAARIDKDRR